MTAETVAPPPAAAPPASSQPPANPPPAAAPPASEPPATPPAPKAFEVPEAYKSKPWAAKIKSEEDLYKQIDGAQELIGRKRAAPDFANSTPEQIEEFLSSTRPKDADAYKFPEGVAVDKAFAEGVPKLLHELGLPDYVGNKLIEKYVALESHAVAQSMSEEGFKAEMKKSFGDNFDKKVVEITNAHKKFVSADDQKMLDSMPNEYYGVVARLTSSILAAHGIKDEGAAGGDGKTGSPQAKDIQEVRKELREQIADLDKGYHTEEEKQALINKLNDTYKGK